MQNNTYTDDQIWEYQKEAREDFIPKSRKVSEIRKEFNLVNNTGIKQTQWENIMRAVQTCLWASPLARKLLEGPKGNKIKFLEVDEEMHLVEVVAALPELQAVTQEPRKYARWLINQYAPRNNGGSDNSLAYMTVGDDNESAGS